MKINKLLAEQKRAIVQNKALPIEERRAAHKELMEAKLNPIDEKKFDPLTFDPMYDVPDFEVKKRVRKEPPRRLPCRGMLPKEILEGQMAGMFESKQDLYLLIAWLSNRVSDLEDRLNGG